MGWVNGGIKRTEVSPTHRLTEVLVASALLHRDSHRLVMAEAPPAMTYSKKTMMNTR